VHLQPYLAKTKSQKVLVAESEVNTPIYLLFEVPSFGISNQMRNPEKLLKDMK
jgi:hypothetical protein